MNNLLGMDTGVPDIERHSLRRARGLSAVHSSCEPATTKPVPRPTAKGTAHWEGWEPQVDFCPRMRKEWDDIALKFRRREKNGQVTESASRSSKASRNLSGTKQKIAEPLSAPRNSLRKFCADQESEGHSFQSTLQENCLRSSRRRILPDAVFGMLSTK